MHTQRFKSIAHQAAAAEKKASEEYTYTKQYCCCTANYRLKQQYIDTKNEKQTHHKYYQ